MRSPLLKKLETYRSKRDFSKTLEPEGGQQRVEGAGKLYVMHKHAASHDHFDLRLEHEGVLRSWALPKGPSLEPGEKRLAVEVEDHPLEYGAFEGVIPEGEYGGGTIMLWDAGVWDVKGKHNNQQIDFVLSGTKLKGAWTLVRLAGRGESKRQWLLIKRSDSPAKKLNPDDKSIVSGRSMAEIAKDRDKVWTAGGEQSTMPTPENMEGAEPAPLPEAMTPQLATLTTSAPAGDNWVHEIKYDGYRMLARLENGKVKLFTRNGKDWSHRFPEIVQTLAELPADAALLDGEVVATAKGNTSFRRLQEALSVAKTGGLSYYCFDLLHLNGYDLTAVPLAQRKQALKKLLDSRLSDGTAELLYSDHVVGRGGDFYEHSCSLGLEGMISKRADAGYHHGRSRHWLKTKCVQHRKFVVGGFSAAGGARSGFGALLLGGFDGDKFCYAGRVGTGFSERQLKSLHAMLKKLVARRCPFDDQVPNSADVTWTKPKLVVEVEYTEQTRDGYLRHPVFRGLREDRQAEEISLGKDVALADDTATSKAPEKGRRRDVATVAGVAISHPERVVYPEQGVTKLALARYYEGVADWILPQIERRPLVLLRCPEGREECFFQKHPGKSLSRSTPRLSIAERSGKRQYVYVESVRDLISLVQMGALEIHPWGSRIDDLERPDMLIFDLDPSPEVPWKHVVVQARNFHRYLDELGLANFLRITGGKGLHLVVPLVPDLNWEEAKAFARAISQNFARRDPARLTTNMSKAKRRGKIFVDYLRNARGSTAIASYSARARPGAPVAVPLRWQELSASMRPDQYRINTLRRRLSALGSDPWGGFEGARSRVTAEMLKQLGLT